MPSTAEVAGAQLAYVEAGSGPALLTVHGMADRGSPLQIPGMRAIAYDRRGYGESSAPVPYERTTVAEQAEDAASLLLALDAAPAVVCGREFGALVALDLCSRHRGLVRAAAVVDPPLFAFSAAATEVLAAERLALEEALRDSGPAGAVAGWLRARGASEERVAWAAEDYVAFFADYAGLATWPTARRELRAWDVPLAVVLSATAPAHVRQAGEALAALVPGARSAPETELAEILRDLL
jgi:pimeloyl-ACP methyl ester carboxylesterase